MEEAMKKVFALLLAVCMLATVMVGCNNNNGGPNANASE